MSREQLLLALEEPPRPFEATMRMRVEARGELLAALRRARLAGVDLPAWDIKELRYWRVVFPQMARWLPDFEQAALVADFRRELDRMSLVSAGSGKG